MGDSHNKLRGHIHAAKDWLGKAENSIDADNDIRSDLNLMLAQAELQRAQETKPIKLWKKWFKWTVPWLAAIAIIAGYIFLLRPAVFTDAESNQSLGVSQTNKQDSKENIGAREGSAGSQEDTRSNSTGDVIESLQKDNGHGTTSNDGNTSQSSNPATYNASINASSSTNDSSQSTEDSNRNNSVESSSDRKTDNENSKISNTVSPELQKLMQSAGQVLRE